MGRWVVDEAKTEQRRINDLSRQKEISKRWKKEHEQREAQKADAVAAVQMQCEQARSKGMKASSAKPDAKPGGGACGAYAAQQRQGRHQIVMGDGRARMLSRVFLHGQ